MSFNWDAAKTVQPHIQRNPCRLGRYVMRFDSVYEANGQNGPRFQIDMTTCHVISGEAGQCAAVGDPQTIVWLHGSGKKQQVVASNTVNLLMTLADCSVAEAAESGAGAFPQDDGLKSSLAGLFTIMDVYEKHKVINDEQRTFIEQRFSKVLDPTQLQEIMTPEEHAKYVDIG